MCRIFIIVLLFTSMIGCGTTRPHQSSISPNRAQKISLGTNNSGSNIQLANRTQQQSILGTERSLIYTAFIKIASQTQDSTHLTVKALAKEYDGYVLKSELDYTTIRIDATYLNDAIEKIEKTGKVLSKDIKGTDVTDDYYDFKIRLENAIKTRDRYLQLLEKAVNVQDILSIEKELERMNNTIELLEGRINKMSHQIQYATITVETTEEIKPGIIGSVFNEIYKGVKWLFVR